MVKKLVVFLGFLACSGVLISPVEAVKKNGEKEVNAGMRKTVGKPKVEPSAKKRIFKVSKKEQDILPSSENNHCCKIQENNLNTVEYLVKNGQTRGLVRPTFVK